MGSYEPSLGWGGGVSYFVTCPVPPLLLTDLIFQADFSDSIEHDKNDLRIFKYGMASLPVEGGAGIATLCQGAMRVHF